MEGDCGDLGRAFSAANGGETMTVDVASSGRLAGAAVITCGWIEEVIGAAIGAVAGVA